jgi:ArsR family metal-binding transcriptional regulator
MNADDKLIGDWKIQVLSMDCQPGADLWSVRVFLDDDISEVLPYLNTALSSTMLCSNPPALIWKDVSRRYAFRAHEISIAPVKDNEEALRVAEDVIRMVNDIWGRRDGIRPDNTCKEPPSLLEIFKLLPKSNCKKCGRATCMAFAGDLREGRATVEECAPLCESGRDPDCERLQGLLS